MARDSQHCCRLLRRRPANRRPLREKRPHRTGPQPNPSYWAKRADHRDQALPPAWVHRDQARRPGGHRPIRRIEEPSALPNHRLRPIHWWARKERPNHQKLVEHHPDLQRPVAGRHHFPNRFALEEETESDRSPCSHFPTGWQPGVAPELVPQNFPRIPSRNPGHRDLRRRFPREGPGAARLPEGRPGWELELRGLPNPSRPERRAPLPGQERQPAWRWDGWAA